MQCKACMITDVNHLSPLNYDSKNILHNPVLAVLAPVIRLRSLAPRNTPPAQAAQDLSSPAAHEEPQGIGLRA